MKRLVLILVAVGALALLAGCVPMDRVPGGPGGWRPPVIVPIRPPHGPFGPPHRGPYLPIPFQPHFGGLRPR